MIERLNNLGQPIGRSVPDWSGASAIPHHPISGRYCDLIPFDMKMAEALYDAYSTDHSGRLWTYMPVGPFEDAAKFANWMNRACNSLDPLFYGIQDKVTGQAVGQSSYLRITPADGVVEVGYIAFSPLLQRTRMATEAMYLMMKHVFDDLGYRRYEWKCDALNAASRTAARRLGFAYEGTFRQALVYKGRNRDTAWFSVTDKEWVKHKVAFEQWLDPANFDDNGQQMTALEINAARPV